MEFLRNEALKQQKVAGVSYSIKKKTRESKASVRNQLLQLKRALAVTKKHEIMVEVHHIHIV